MSHIVSLKDILNPEKAKAILYNMYLIRSFEDACAEQYSAGKIRGFLHLYVGQESIACSILPLLNPQDQFFGTYREHAHALVRGVSPQAIMAEMFGKVTGCSKGRGGSMHIFDISKAFYGGNAIVAAHIPLAVGMALANIMQKNNLITACFFGEGAIAEGEFHESLNLAQLWGLPVLFVCENNYYAMGTSLERSESQLNLCKKAESYNVHAKRVSGVNVPQIIQEAREAIEYIRKYKKPFFLECDTYRFRAHSMFDSQQYRSKEEVEEWKRFDPIPLFTHQLKNCDWINAHEIKIMQNKINNIIAESVEYAERGEYEDKQHCIDDVTLRSE